MTPGPSNEGDPNEGPPNQASPAESASRGGPQSPKIRIRDLYKSFGTKHVLSGMDLDVGAGESVVVIGGSGSGKSVTLKCVLGLLQPEEGSIQVDGEEVVGLGGESLELVRRKFGMLFQNAALFDSLTVWQNVAFGLIQGQGMARRQAREIAFDRLTAVGLEAEVGNMWPAELSGGMRKRVGLARAIATSPDIIFFDEPTTGLDPIMGDVIDELIVKCVRELGATALSITHGADGGDRPVEQSLRGSVHPRARRGPHRLDGQRLVRAVIGHRPGTEKAL
jgi:phospholipid/cholesterol/gamma-HCH transport system ATP-binding protein